MSIFDKFKTDAPRKKNEDKVIDTKVSTPKVIDAKAQTTVGATGEGAEPQITPDGMISADVQKYGWPYEQGASYIYRSIENKTLHIILIENSEETYKIKEKISQIVVGTTKGDAKGLTCIVNYGETIHYSEPISTLDVQKTPALVETDIGKSARLYDALCALNSLITTKKKSIEDDKLKRVKITEIDILGIGTCKDADSKHSKEEAIAAFEEILKNSPLTTVTTKYFCLTEVGIVEAAEFGFRSIGSISNSYQ